MKKLSVFAFAALFAVGSVFFTACTKKETVETNNTGMTDSDGIPDGNIDIVIQRERSFCRKHYHR